MRVGLLKNMLHSRFTSPVAGSVGVSCVGRDDTVISCCEGNEVIEGLILRRFKRVQDKFLEI